MLNTEIPDELKVVLLGKQLTPVPSAKDLGIIIDSNLSYDEHIVHLVSSCLASLCRINRVKHLFSSKSLTTIINALVLNKLFHCSSVWGNTSQQNIVIVGLLFVLRWRPGIDLAQQDSVTLFFIRSSTVVLELHNSPEEKQG